MRGGFLFERPHEMMKTASKAFCRFTTALCMLLLASVVLSLFWFNPVLRSA